MHRRLISSSSLLYLSLSSFLILLKLSLPFFSIAFYYLGLSSGFDLASGFDLSSGFDLGFAFDLFFFALADFFYKGSRSGFAI